VPDLAVEQLGVDLTADGVVARVLDDVTLRVPAGGAVAVVGESGAGKTLLLRSILGLLPSAARIAAGRITLGTQPPVALLDLDDAGWRTVRGRHIAWVPQEPALALDPLRRVVDDVAEAVRAHAPLPRRAARQRALSLLSLVGLPASRATARPHELSGGQRQRVLWAAALAADAGTLLADEPTAALDGDSREALWAMLHRQRHDAGRGLLLVTHDLTLAARCDDVVVLYAGRVVERGPPAQVLAAPRHPYTRALCGARPSSATAGRPLPTLPGSSSAPSSWPTGCRLRDRCPEVQDACAVVPALVAIGGDVEVRCVHAGRSL
jgi:peptide/nickel transport system ATP-binding protein